MKIRSKNIINLLNDFFCSNLGIQLSVFSNWISDKDTQYSVGWVYVIQMSLLMIIGFSPVVSNLIRQTRLIWIKYQRRLLYKFGLYKSTEIKPEVTKPKLRLVQDPHDPSFQREIQDELNEIAKE